MTTPRVDDRDWSVLTLGERIRQIEVEGYLVLPDLLRTDQVRRLKTQTATLETSAVDYSIHQRYRRNLQFSGGAITELAAHPPAISFLETLLGRELIIMSYSYARSLMPAPSRAIPGSVCTPTANPMAPTLMDTRAAFPSWSVSSTIWMI